MRIEAHNGPQPFRKVAFSNPIVEWSCKDAPRTQGSPAISHVTMFYLNDGDSIIPRAQQILDALAPSRMIQVQAPMEIGADSGGSPIVWLVLPETFTKYAKILVDKFGKQGLKVSQDTGRGQNISHITIARTNTGAEAQAVFDSLKDQYSGMVTLEGPLISDSAGQQIPRTSSTRISSMMDVVIDMLEFS